VSKDDQTDRAKHTFRTKANAKKGGAVKNLLGTEVGSVRLEKERGGFRRDKSGSGLRFAILKRRRSGIVDDIGCEVLHSRAPSVRTSHRRLRAESQKSQADAGLFLTFKPVSGI
jgi:hypothetical protein